MFTQGVADLAIELFGRNLVAQPVQLNIELVKLSPTGVEGFDFFGGESAVLVLINALEDDLAINISG